MHRARLLGAAALGAIVLAGCSLMSPTPVTKFDKAKDLQNDGKYTEAVTQYKLFIADKEYPGLLPYAQYNIACSYRSLGKMTEARDAYKKVMDLYPTSDPAQWAKDELKELDKTMMAAPPAKMAPAAPALAPATPAPATPAPK
jgi:TolA-binding protein